MLNILKALLMVILTILGVGVILLIIGGVAFSYIFGDAAIWIVRIVLLVLIAKFVWQKILT